MKPLSHSRVHYIGNHGNYSFKNCVTGPNMVITFWAIIFKKCPNVQKGKKFLLRSTTLTVQALRHLRRKIIYLFTTFVQDANMQKNDDRENLKGLCHVLGVMSGIKKLNTL